MGTYSYGRSQRLVTPNKQNVIKCAANAADKVIVAGGAHKLGVPEKRVAAFVTDAIGGNTFSALTNVVTTFTSHFQSQGGHNAFYNAGQALVAGPTQGLGLLAGKSIEGTAFAAGPVDSLLGKVLGDAAPAVGQIKLGYDGLTYVGALVGCATGSFQGVGD